MLSEKIFPLAFIISVSVHAAFLTQNLSWNALSFIKPNLELKVQYIKAQKKHEYTQGQPLKGQPFLKMDQQVTSKKNMSVPPPYILKSKIQNKDGDSNIKEAVIDKPSILKPEITALKKKITLPALEMENIDNPSYISYYQIVREKIRRAAYRNYNSNETGEVYISFIISDTGQLKETRMIEQKSSSSSYLQNTGLKSIEEAAPFPDFPKSLDYPQLSFNVEISFKLE